MKIVKLTAENVKRISAVTITPDGNLTVIGGKNGAGKCVPERPQEAPLRRPIDHSEDHLAECAPEWPGQGLAEVARRSDRIVPESAAAPCAEH